MMVSHCRIRGLLFAILVTVSLSGCASTDAADDAGRRCFVETDSGNASKGDAGTDAGSESLHDAGITIKCADVLPEKCDYKLCKEQCESFCGVMSKYFTGQPYCRCPTSDGGKKCNSTSDCEGECILEVNYYDINNCEKFSYGYCTYWQFELGCHCQFFDGPPATRVCGD